MICSVLGAALSKSAGVVQTPSQALLKLAARMILTRLFVVIVDWTQYSWLQAALLRWIYSAGFVALVWLAA